MRCILDVVHLHTQGSPVEVDQLRQDKEELLNQVVALQQEQEASALEKEKLSKKVKCKLMSFSHMSCGECVIRLRS